jgi:hypothetical protein
MAAEVESYAFGATRSPCEDFQLTVFYTYVYAHVYKV